MGIQTYSNLILTIGIPVEQFLHDRAREHARKLFLHRRLFADAREVNFLNTYDIESSVFSDF